MTSSLRLRLAVSIAVLSTAAGGLAALAAPSDSHSDGAATTRLAPLADDADVAAMIDLETKMTDSFRVGKAVPVIFGSSQQTPGNVVSAPYWGDTELWTGVYLGGESMRYSVAKHYLAKADHGRSTDDGQADRADRAASHDNRDRPDAQKAFWTAQRDESLARVREMLKAEHRDINIAEDWTGELRVPPSVNTANPTGPHTADFGGGVIQGERGMITRGCTPVGLGPLGISSPNHDEANPVNDHSNHVYQITWTHGDGGTYNCETSPSRDTYAGLTFGLLTAFDLVGPDEPALRAQIRDDLLSMGNFLVKYGWNFPRPNGYVATGNDQNGFLTPLMVQVPMARLNMTNAARHVADVAGTAADQQKWDAIWKEEFASQGPILGMSMEVDAAQPNESYYKFNLHHLTGFSLLRTLTGTERDVVARGFAVMDKTTGDDVNAHFEAITYAATGDKDRLDAAVTHLRQWLTYRSNIENGQRVTNSARCGPKLACVPKDEYDLAIDQAPGGSLTWYPGAPDAPPVSKSAGPRAARPLPVALRPPADFLWQRPPTALDGQQGAAWREPGVDFLTPYWMIRYYTEVAPPAATPLPEWVGPAHL